jgi:hypothetical protein
MKFEVNYFCLLFATYIFGCQSICARTLMEQFITKMYVPSGAVRWCKSSFEFASVRSQKNNKSPVLNDPNWQPQHYLRFFLVTLTCPAQRLMAGSA